VSFVKRVGYVYDDYAEISFTATQASYTVGTNARAAVPGAWPNDEPAKDVLLYADQDCYVRFNRGDAVQHLIPADTYMRFQRRCTVIYVVRVSVDGTLRCWLEG